VALTYKRFNKTTLQLLNCIHTIIQNIQERLKNAVRCSYFKNFKLMYFFKIAKGPTENFSRMSEIRVLSNGAKSHCAYSHLTHSFTGCKQERQ